MRKIFAVLILLSVIFVIAACKPEEKQGFNPIGDNSANASTGTEAQTPAAPQANTTAKPAETQANAAAPITIPNITANTAAPIANASVFANASEEEKYYSDLANNNCGQTAFPDCCNKSVAAMKAGQFKLSTEINCPSGYSANRLTTCIGSLRWCEPIDINAIDESKCYASADCIPKPICHAKVCINKQYAVNYVMPSACEGPNLIDQANAQSDCDCINSKCVNNKA